MLLEHEADREERGEAGAGQRGRRVVREHADRGGKRGTGERGAADLGGRAGEAGDGDRGSRPHRRNHEPGPHR